MINEKRERLVEKRVIVNNEPFPLRCRNDDATPTWLKVVEHLSKISKNVQEIKFATLPNLFGFCHAPRVISILSQNGELHDWKLKNLSLFLYSYQAPIINPWIEQHDKTLERLLICSEIADLNNFPRQGIWGCQNLHMLEIVNYILNPPNYQCFLNLRIEKLKIKIDGNTDEACEILFQLRETLQKLTFSSYRDNISSNDLLDSLLQLIQLHSPNQNRPKIIPFALSHLCWFELILPTGENVPRFLQVFPNMTIFQPKSFPLNLSFDLARGFLDLYAISKEKECSSFTLIGGQIDLKREELASCLNTNFDPRFYKWDFNFGSPQSRSIRRPDGSYQRVYSNPPMKEIVIEKGKALFVICIGS